MHVTQCAGSNWHPLGEKATLTANVHEKILTEAMDLYKPSQHEKKLERSRGGTGPDSRVIEIRPVQLHCGAVGCTGRQGYHTVRTESRRADKTKKHVVGTGNKRNLQVGFELAQLR